jgi:hypothetical protein
MSYESIEKEGIKHKIRLLVFVVTFLPNLASAATLFDSNRAADVDMAPLDNTTFVLAWISEGSGNNASFEVRDTNGTVIVDRIDIDTSGSAQSRISVAAINSTHFVLALYDPPGLVFFIYERNGNQVLGRTTLNPNIGPNRIDVSAAELGDRFVVCNANEDNNRAEFRILNNSGGINTTGVVDQNMDPNENRVNLVECAPISGKRWAYAWFDRQSRDVTIALLDETGSKLDELDVDLDVGDSGRVALAGLRNNYSAFMFYDSATEDVVLAIYDATGDNFSPVLEPTDVDRDPGTDSKVSVAEVDVDGNSYIVASWWDQGASEIEAAVYASNGNRVTAPFTVDDNPEPFYLVDVMSSNSRTGLSICNGTFIVAYTNSSGNAVFKRYRIDGSEWDGVCDTTPPTIALGDPANNSWSNSANVTFYYTPNDEKSDIASCSLVINGVLNQSNRTRISEGIENNIWTILRDGTYSWTVSCTDTAFVPNTGTSASVKLINVDTTPPSVINISYVPLAEDDLDPDVRVNVTVNVTDNLNLTSVILQYKEANATTFLNFSMNNTSGDLYEGNFTAYTANNWTFRILAEDASGNQNTSAEINISVVLDKTFLVNDTIPPIKSRVITNDPIMDLGNIT